MEHSELLEMIDRGDLFTRKRAERVKNWARQIANCGQSIEPDHWKFRCMARELAAKILKELNG